MRKLVAAALALAVVALLAGCTVYVNGPGQHGVIPVGGIASASAVPTAIATSVSCPTGTRTLSKSNVRYVITGSCSEVRVTGSSVGITASHIDKLSIKGSFDSVVAGSIGTLTITGDTDTVTSPGPTKVRIDGYYNVVKVSGPIASANVTGDNNTVTSSSKIPNIHESGAGNQIGPG